MAIHDDELRRRFHETDFVAEYQKNWAYFNQWFIVETNKTQDRSAIESLKTNHKIQGIINTILSEGRKHVIDNDSLSRDYQIQLADNEVISFVNTLWQCRIIVNSLNLFNPHPINHVRGIGTISLTHLQYKKLYRIVRGQESSPLGMPLTKLIEKLYNYAGIIHVGSCFFRDPSAQPPLNNPFFENCWIEIEGDVDLTLIGDLRHSNHIPGICSDIIEMLYLVRCKSVHGDLDFLDATHNEACKAALFLLQRIIKDLI